jgi:hypothetical protein
MQQPPSPERGGLLPVPGGYVSRTLQIKHSPPSHCCAAATLSNKMLVSWK